MELPSSCFLFLFCCFLSLIILRCERRSGCKRTPQAPEAKVKTARWAVFLFSTLLLCGWRGACLLSAAAIRLGAAHKPFSGARGTTACVAAFSNSIRHSTPSNRARIMINGDEAAAGDRASGVGVVGRGAFILFEGVDRCGKTTQANLLVESLRESGHDACFMRFPGQFTYCIVSMVERCC